MGHDLVISEKKRHRIASMSNIKLIAAFAEILANKTDSYILKCSRKKSNMPCSTKEHILLNYSILGNNY